MSNHGPIEPMEHDGSFLHSHPFSRSTPNNVSSTSASSSPLARLPGPLSLQDQAGTSVGGPSVPQRPTTPTTPCRVFCPVVGCPESLTSSNRNFRDFKSIKNHLNDHCTGHISGAVPAVFLSQNSYSQCSVCNKLVHTRFHGTCIRCRPTARLRAQFNSLRANNRTADITSETTPASDQQRRHTQEQGNLPSLSDVHERFVPTIKNIRLGLRRLWAQCLVKTLAQAVWTNSEADWTALQMLPKCTLCRQVRGGKSHRSQRMEWTRGRLQRWLAGERASLWHDLPLYRRPQTKDSARAQQHQRCIALTSEGGYSNACKALTSPPPCGQTAEAAAQLREKHPPSSRPIDLSTYENANSTLVPHIETTSVEQCIRSFHRLSGGGPSGLRPIHLKNCLSTEHRDETVERCTALVNLLAKGDAPESLAPFLAGGNLTALPKKDNGIRPIAVGEVWRRLTAKCLCNEFKEQTSAHFFPQQIGVGQPQGTEVGLETARQWCSRNCNNPTSVFVKVDFANAFNCVDRQAFLEQCRHNFPGLSRWAEWCYKQPSNLYFGTHSIVSE